METTTIRHTADSAIYWNMLKNLAPDVKLDLISRLSASLITVVKSPSTERNWAMRLSGRWEDDRSTEQIISDIHEARTKNREIEL